MKKFIILGLVITFILSIIIGYYLYRIDKENEKIAFDTKYTEVKIENIDIKSKAQETSTSEKSTTPNTRMIKKIYYKDCDHLIQEKEKIEEQLVNKNESEIQTEYIGWEIQKFSPQEVVLYKEINDFCDEHYKLKDVDGEIVVFQLDKYGNEKCVVEETGIQTKYLTEEDIENLKQGIKAYGVEELNALIEDYE